MHLQPCLPSIMLFNARSLSNKFNDFEVTLVSNYNNLHVIAVTETWFCATNHASTCQLSYFVQFDRSDRISGGVALYVREDINERTVFSDLIPLHLEVLWVNLKSSSTVRLMKNIYICVFYSPPQSQFKEELHDHIITMIDNIRLAY